MEQRSLCQPTGNKATTGRCKVSLLDWLLRHTSSLKSESSIMQLLIVSPEENTDQQMCKNTQRLFTWNMVKTSFSDCLGAPETRTGGGGKGDRLSHCGSSHQDTSMV